MWKKITVITLALLLGLSCLSGCSVKENGEELSIVCTVFPLYDWTKNILGEDTDARLYWLTDKGADLHSFQPSAEDMVRVASADLVIFVGGQSDAWLREALRTKTEGEVLEISSLEGIRLAAVTDESGHSHEDGHGHETDEHLWLSLKNAQIAVKGICDALAEIDPDRAETYRANEASYADKLSALDSAYEAAVSSVEKPRMLVADRFPFVYLAEDYGIDYLAAFSGCTTDVDADLSVVIRLGNRLKEWGLSSVVITERSDRSLAESVIRAAEVERCEILILHSMQGVRRTDAEGGVSYLSVMEENLRTLSRAIGGT